MFVFDTMFDLQTCFVATQAAGFDGFAFFGHKTVHLNIDVDNRAVQLKKLATKARNDADAAAASSGVNANVLPPPPPPPPPPSANSIRYAQLRVEHAVRRAGRRGDIRAKNVLRAANVAEARVGDAGALNDADGPDVAVRSRQATPLCRGDVRLNISWSGCEVPLPDTKVDILNDGYALDYKWF